MSQRILIGNVKVSNDLSYDVFVRPAQIELDCHVGTTSTDITPLTIEAAAQLRDLLTDGLHLATGIVREAELANADSTPPPTLAGPDPSPGPASPNVTAGGEEVAGPARAAGPAASTPGSVDWAEYAACATIVCSASAGNPCRGLLGTTLSRPHPGRRKLDAVDPDTVGCPAHGLHPHGGARCLDCPACVGADEDVDVIAYVDPYALADGAATAEELT